MPAARKSNKTAPSAPPVAKGWRKKTGEPLLLPSGQTVLCKRPGVEQFLTDGLIPDSLAPLVQAQIESAQGGKPLEMKTEDLSKDPQKVADILRMMDNAVLACVVEPRVEAAPANPADRDPAVFYPDDIEMEDKLFIFNFAVGGTRDLERFREESARALAGVADVTGVQVAS